MEKEEIIKGLEFTKEMTTFNPSTGEEIAPENLNELDKITYDSCVGAIALLKEQETVEPKQVDLYGKDEWWGLVCVCPDCNAEWMTDKANTHFCPNCGKSVKWE